jgi:myo-inositol-1-phosphate synthase
MNKEGRIVIAGVGNCASALVQGLEYYRHHDPAETAGLIHVEVGGYRVEDVFAEPNCSTVFQPKLGGLGVTVQMGPVLLIEGSAR